MGKNKIVSAEDAVRLIAPGDTICTSGFIGTGVPEALLLALQQRFLETGEPHDLSLLFAAGQGDGQDRGLNRLGEPGLLKRVVGGHWGLAPRVAKLALEEQIEAYNLPQGVISHLYRDIAAGRPGAISKVGLGTFVDPRLEGGKVNQRSTEDLVSLLTLDGEEFLHYKAFPLQIALLRGTTADANGNITMEHEALLLDNLPMAMAVRNSGGKVIVQVERVARNDTLDARQVHIPANLVDAIVVAEPELHRQTYATAYSPALCGRSKPLEQEPAILPLSARKVIARRCAFELPMNGVVNLGIGMPEGVAAVAAEEGLLKQVTLTAEPGVIGGQPCSGLDFGTALNTDATIPQHQQFDFYDGGGLDLACLGMAEADAQGNVNVSRFGDRLTGAGGFINISQNARKVIFCGTFTAGGLEVTFAEGRLHIGSEGQAKKFVKAVEQVTFSGAVSASSGQYALFVTERAVFRLAQGAMQLIEVAPGIDIERDVLSLMDFTPGTLHVGRMESCIFEEGKMGLKERLLGRDIQKRYQLDYRQSLMMIDFSDFRVRSPKDLEDIRQCVTQICEPLPNKVDVFVNYDRFEIDEEMKHDYAKLINTLQNKYYRSVKRYSSSMFDYFSLGLRDS